MNPRSNNGHPAAPRRALWITVLLVALAARAAFGTWRLVRAPDPAALEFPDEEQYWLMARSLVSGEGLRDELGFRATRMPLYPGFLALFAPLEHGVIAAKVAHWFLGAAAAALVAMFATKLFDRRVGWLAGLAVALDPFLVFFSSLLLTETPYTAAVVGLIWCTWRVIKPDGPPAHPLSPGRIALKPWLMTAILAVLAVHLRESSMGLVGALLLFVLACRRFDREGVIGAALVAAVVFASLVPWAVRNRAVTGEWSWLTTRAGISLYDGVRPGATGASDLGGIKQMPAVSGLNEHRWNRYFLERSIESIKADPARILRLAGVKLARMWNPVPNVGTYQSTPVRLISAVWTLPIFGLAVLGAILLPISRQRDGRRLVVLLLLPAVYLSLLHSVFVGSVRYRLGAVALLEILAAGALIAMFDRMRAKPEGE